MAAPPAPVTDAEIAAWFAGKSFTTDWASTNYPIWIDILAAFRTRPARVLEIGAWEGRSALFFLNYMPRSHLTSIDTWGGGDEHQDDARWSSLIADSERCFDANLAAFASRLEKIKAASAAALADLAIASRRFDVVYVDGSHRAPDVYSDGALAWTMLEPGGVMIFDDYEWHDMPDARDRPKLGIDAFLAAIPGQYREILRHYQMIIGKT